MKGLRAMYVTAVNVSTSPVTIDAAGRQISPGEWGTADLDDPGARAALDDGLINIVEYVAEDATEAALDAQRRTTQVNARADDLKRLDDDTLSELADAAGIPTEGQSRDALLGAIAPRTDIDLPEAQPVEQPVEVAEQPADPEQGEPTADAEDSDAESDPPVKQTPPRKSTSRRQRAAEGTE